MSTSPRLDAELVRRGLARSRARAAELVAGGRVRVGDSVARKPSQAVPGGAELVVVDDGVGSGYVSRAAHKLIGVLDALGPSGPAVRGASCLDAGASTGGFTQVLLERGARSVLAVDVGHGQMAAEVAADPRVSVREGVNVRDLVLDADPVDLVVADLSFISLTVVLPALLAAVRGDGDLLLMVKPQFEVGRERLGASGVVSSAALREDAVTTVARSARGRGASVRAVVPSTLPGPAGNREYFLWLVPTAAEVTDDVVASAVRRAVHEDVPVRLDVPVWLDDARGSQR